MKFAKLTSPVCLAIGGLACWLTSPALAHGTSTGSAGGGVALLIFPAAVIVFVFFLVFTRSKKGWTVLVTGGAGYVGSALVPKLLQHGHRVVVLDLYPNGDDVFKTYQGYENLRQIKGDFTDLAVLGMALRGCDAVIHLAGITSRSPSEPGSQLVRPANLDAFGPLLDAAKSAGVKRFIFASSRQLDDVAGKASPSGGPALETDGEYFEDKARCEQALEASRAPGFVVSTVRAADVCGAALSQRLDAGINALAWDGFANGHIQVTGGGRKIPYIHVDDLAAFYLLVLNQPDGRIDGKTFSISAENPTLLDLAETVRSALGGNLVIDVAPVDDPGSHGQGSDEISRDFNFQTKHSAADAVRELVAGFQSGNIAPPIADSQQINMEERQELSRQ